MRGNQGHKIKNAFLGLGRSAVGWAAPLTSEYQERSIQRRGVCIESRCRTQIALQRDMRHPGGDKSESPGRCPSHLGVRVAGRRATPLPAGRRPCMGGAGRGARSNPEARLPGWRCYGGAPAGTRSREEGRGARNAARARGARGQRRQEGAPPRVRGARGRWDPGWCGALTPCGLSSGSAGGGGSSGGGSSGSASSTAPPSLRRLLRLRSPPPPTTTFGDVTPVT